MGISVRKARTVAGVAIGLVGLLFLVLMLCVCILGERNHWPMYITLLLAFILSVSAMAGSIHLAGMRWCKWAYMNVSDVHELDTASYLTGFIAYPPSVLEKKYPNAYAAIMQRYAHYVFADDDTLPYETEVYYKRLWQSQRIVFCLATALFFFYLVAHSPANMDGEGLALFLGCAGLPLLMAAHRAFKLSDRSAQLICSNDALTMQGVSMPWHEIDRCQIIQDESSSLICETNGHTHSMRIEELAGGFAHLNHLLFIYSRRHRRDHPALYKNR